MWTGLYAFFDVAPMSYCVSPFTCIKTLQFLPSNSTHSSVSACLSVTFSYTDHVGWECASKIISRLISLRLWLMLTRLLQRSVTLDDLERVKCTLVVDFKENLHISCHQMASFKAKMHRSRFRLGLRPKPRWGSLQRSRRPSSWILGAYF